MVRLGSSLLSAAKRMIADGSFCDWLPIHVRGGAGGQGLQRHGGRGGDGGDVVLMADNECQCPEQDLSSVAKRVTGKKLIAGAGENSRLSALTGKRGADVLLKVPPGVMVRLDNGLEAGDLVEAGDKLVIARGGQGGSAETAFNGSAGDKTGLTLVLKLLTDAAVVGFSGAGKSSLVAAMTSGPATATSSSKDPITTSRPHVSTIKYHDGREITVADLPPLSRVVTNGTGTGSSRFLRHSERASVILFVVDPVRSLDDTVALPKIAGVPRATLVVMSTLLQLIKELERYKPQLLNKRALLVLSKSDASCDTAALDVLVREQLTCLPELSAQMPVALRPKKLVEFDDVLCVSAKQAASIELLKGRLREAVDRAADSDGHAAQLAEQLRHRLERDVRGRGADALPHDSYLL